MLVTELLRSTELSRADVLLRIQNAKSDGERAIWSTELSKYTIGLSEEKIGDYFKRIVKEKGIKKLGAGAFARVFQHPEFKNVVVKVYVDKDVAYKKYLKWCLRNQNNPFVPKVIEEVKYNSDAGDAYNILFLEKLHKFNSEEQLTLALSKAFDLGKGDEREKNFDELGEAVSTWDNPGELYNVLEKFVSAGRSKSKDFERLWAHIKTYGYDAFDLHAGNAMRRGSQIVITDPVASGASTSRVDEL